jgi:hypothetical protein
MSKKKSPTVSKKVRRMVQAGESSKKITDEFVRDEFNKILEGKKPDRSVKAAALVGRQKAKRAGISQSGNRKSAGR